MLLTNMIVVILYQKHKTTGIKLTSWTKNPYHSIAIQHDNNLIFYIEAVVGYNITAYGTVALEHILRLLQVEICQTPQYGIFNP